MSDYDLEISEFVDSRLNSEHRMLLYTIDSLLRQLVSHDEYESSLVKDKHHSSLHSKTIIYVQKLREYVIKHINEDDTKLFDTL